MSYKRKTHTIKILSGLKIFWTIFFLILILILTLSLLKVAQISHNYMCTKCNYEEEKGPFS